MADGPVIIDDGGGSRGNNVTANGPSTFAAKPGGNPMDLGDDFTNSGKLKHRFSGKLSVLTITIDSSAFKVTVQSPTMAIISFLEKDADGDLLKPVQLVFRNVGNNCLAKINEALDPNASFIYPTHGSSIITRVQTDALDFSPTGPGTVSVKIELTT
jgi:hypothetical protein